MELLLIFCKNPIPGKVKTRLAKTIGIQDAKAVYDQLCAHTRKVATQWGGTVAVWHAYGIPPHNPWKVLGPFQFEQQGDDLGQRMAHAFRWGFKQGYKKISIIGSDLWTLTSEDLTQAFAAMDTHSVVWGPATDGGYYLLGLTQMQEALFKNLPWSQPKLLEISRKRIPSETQYLLRQQNDIDTLEDLAAHPKGAVFLSSTLPKKQ